MMNFKLERNASLIKPWLPVLAALAVMMPGAWAADGHSKTNATNLDPHLEPLRPLVGKTWRGEFKSSRPEKPVVDIMSAERAMNGRAVRMLHSINEGSYGGETIYMWNEEKKVVTYHYFTTAGFMTTGTVRFEKNKWQTHELVTGSANGTTEVKGQVELQADGSFVVKTEYLREGKWVAGRETTYREEPTAKVIFR